MQSVGLLWTRDRPVIVTSSWRNQHSQEADFHDPSRIRTRNSSRQGAADPRPRPHGHRDWQELGWKCEIRKNRNQKESERMYEEEGKGKTQPEESKKAGEMNNEESELKKEGRDMEGLKKE